MKKLRLNRVISMVLALVLTLSVALSNNLSIVSASEATGVGEATDTIPGNIIKNPEFESNNFAASGTPYFQWYPNGSTLSQDSTHKNAGTYSMKVSGRTAYWHRAEYREWFGNLAFDKEYYLQGAVSASAATNVEMYVQVTGYGGPAGNEYPSALLALDSASVSANEWKVLSGSLKLTSSPSTTDGKVDVTVHFGNTTQVIQAVTGIDNINIFVQEAYHENSVCPDLYLDSFLIKEGVAPHADGENTETIADNKITNGSFETNDFADNHNHGKWYSTPDSTAVISQVNNYSHSGNYSLKVSNRTAFWHRAQYRVWSGYLTDNTEYNLSGYVAASASTPVELIAVVNGYGGPTGNEYPTVTMTLASGTADSIDWEKLEGKFKISSTVNSNDSNKVDLTVTWGENSQTLTAVSGYGEVELFVQQPSSATSYPDLYYDSFAMQEVKAPSQTSPIGHENGVNTEEDADNMIHNSSFETNNFATSVVNGTWYNEGATIEQFAEASQSGSNSLRVSNRTANWHRATYRVDGSGFSFNKEYSLSGYVASETDANVELVLGVWGYGGPAGNEYPVQYITLDSASTNVTDWTQLLSKFTLTKAANATNSSKYDITLTNGTQSVTVECVDGLAVMEIMVQEAYHTSTDCPDLYMDSFLLKAVSETVPTEPAGHQNGTNTEEDADNMIHNSSFETNDFASAIVNGKWYNSGATIEQFADASQSGNNSLRVSNRTAHWHRAAYRVDGSEFGYDKEYSLSGYVASETETAVELLLGVYGYGGPTGNEYPVQYITVSSASANVTDWSKLASSFTLTKTVNTTNSSKYDITLASGTQSVTVEYVDGLAVIEIMVQEAYHANIDCPDLYMDSFLLKEVPKEVEKLYPSGHQNGTNTEKDADNMIHNSSFETNNFTSAVVNGTWYNNGAAIEQFASASQSGSNSLRVSDRTAHWNRAQYRVDGSEFIFGRDYNLSGYVASEAATTVELMVGIWGYGGSAENPYPVQYITLDSGIATIDKWLKLEGDFSITQKQNAADASKYDLTVTYGEQSVIIEGVSGLSAVELFVQEAYHPNTDCPDLYMDSFLLKDVTLESAKPTGHTGATDTSKNQNNIIKNGGFEKNDYAKENVSGKWYADPSSATLKNDTTFSHSGKSSLLISNREEHWNRATYQVIAEELILGHTYALSGYISSTEDVSAELMVEVCGYAGTETNRTYPSQYFTIDAANVTAGCWSKLSGEFTITQKETSQEGIYDLVISWSGGEDIIIQNVKGLSAIRIMPQETYSAAKGRADLYLDSFLLVDVTPKAAAPKGHSNQTNTQNLSGNLIKNGSFENNDFVHGGYVLDKWYTAEGCLAKLSQDKTFSHSGKASLKITNREEFWNRAEYRIEGSNFIMGDEYKVSGYVSSPEDTNAEMYIQVYGYGGPSSDPYPSQLISVDKAAVKAGKWTELSATFKITVKHNGEAGYYDYTITVGGTDATYTIKHVKGLSLVQLMVQETYSEVTPRADLYLDSFSLVNQTKRNMPMPKGHAGEANTEDIVKNMINNSSFESNLYEDAPNIGLWFTNSDHYDVEQSSKYSHSGEYSTRIYNRKSASDTLMYRVEGANITMGTEYTLSGFVAAALQTDVELVMTVYGYAGTENNRTYPSKTIVIDRETVKAWKQLSGIFMLEMENDHLYITTEKGKVDIGECLGLSNLEIYVLTDQTKENYTSDLYLDSFSLLEGAVLNAESESGEDILVSDFMDNKEDTSMLNQLIEAVKEVVGNTAYIILIGAGTLVILGSVLVVIRSKRRKA